MFKYCTVFPNELQLVRTNAKIINFSAKYFFVHTLFSGSGYVLSRKYCL